MSEATEAAKAIEAVQKWASMYGRDMVTDIEVVNAVFNIVMEAPVIAAEDCVAAVPPSLRPSLLEAVRATVQRGSYDHWIVYARGWLDQGLDLAQQEQFFKQRQPHYQLVCERLLVCLQSKPTT